MKYFKLSKPVTQEELEQAYKEGLLKKEQLEHNQYYKGNCRNAEVAMWNADKQVFVYMRSKFGTRFPETINHPANDDGYDLFTPWEKVIPSEKETIVGEVHYND